MGANGGEIGGSSVWAGIRAGSTIGTTDERKELPMQRRAWIVIGSLTGVVVCPALVMIVALVLRDIRGPLFGDRGVLVLLVCGAVGLVAGAPLTARVVPGSQRRMTLLGAVCGAVLGAAALGSLLLAIEVTGTDWPDGLSAFVTGAIGGGVLGGILGGVAGSSTGPGVTERGGGSGLRSGGDLSA